MANYSKKMKQLVEKLEENSRFICQRRKAVTFGVGDAEKIENWEKEVSTVCKLTANFLTGMHL